MRKRENRDTADEQQKDEELCTGVIVIKYIRAVLCDGDEFLTNRRRVIQGSMLSICKYVIAVKTAYEEFMGRMKNKGYRIFVILVVCIGICVTAANRKGQVNGRSFGLYGNSDIKVGRQSKRDYETEELDYGYAGTQEDIDKIGQIRNLRKLSISIRGENMDLSPLGNLTELEELELNSYWEIEFDTKPLARLKQLKTITLSQCDVDLAFMAELYNLESICVVRGEVNDLSVFRDLDKLKSLHLRFTSDTDLKELQNLKRLENLEITGGNIRNVEYIGRLTGLRKLHLDETDDYGICGGRVKLDLKILGHMDGLESLSIGHMDIEDLEPLSKMKSLEYITLADTGVSDIMPLSKLSNLRVLIILGNQNETVKMQAERFFSGVEDVRVMEETPAAYW